MQTKKKSSGKETSTRQETRSAKEPSATEENKKVRRSDPVTFDLMSMIQMKAEGKKKAQTQKTPATLSVPGGKKSALKVSSTSTNSHSNLMPLKVLLYMFSLARAATSWTLPRRR